MTLKTAVTTAVLSALVALLVAAPSAPAVSTTLLISEVYGGGGNSGAPYDHDFIELVNVSSSSVSLDSYSVQYASATGSSWQVTPLPSVTVAAGKRFLIQQASGGINGAPLPPPDATGTIALAATSGKVALVLSTAPLSGTCPVGLVDLVGYGSANCAETTPTAALGNSLSAQRKGGQDTDNNSNDFDVAGPQPQNSVSPSAVRLTSFAVDAVPNGIVLRWQTASEAGVLGFNLYREASRARVKLNPTLVPARGGGVYRYRAPKWTLGARYLLQQVGLDGTSTWLASGVR
jgi:predicted extracellular nuclease